MPPALSSPGFLIALGVLLSNDLWWKAAYHSWLTGKLSDVAGLFVVVVLAAAFRPASGRLIAAGAAITFTLWKSPLSQPLIDAWNASAPYRIARVVDYSDLLALAVIPVGLRYAGGACSPAPAALRYPIMALALLAILGTSRAQPTTFPYEAVEGFTLAALPVYDVALAPATIVERLRQANFTVQGPVATDVEILSGVSCQTGVGDGRSVVHALLTIQPSGDVSRLLVQRLELCRRRPPWDSASAAAAFESEVLARIGGGARRP
jgi:hypothetical protein